MSKSDIKELKIRLVSVDYCPICGKSWFKKAKMVSVQTNLLQEADGFWKYRCLDCGFLIYLFSPEYQDKYDALDEEGVKHGKD